jgi:hypothetical protein
MTITNPARNSNRDMQLRAWHIPQVPGEPFHIFVGSVKEGCRVLKLLAQYDLFQFKNGIKPDYSNAQGLEVFLSGEWWEWSDPETGDTIGDYMEAA